MLERYTHPTQTLKVSALETADYLATTTPQKPAARSEAVADDPELRKLLKKSGGRREARTRDLRVANAALSQLS